MKREKYLKTTWGKRYLKNRIRNYVATEDFNLTGENGYGRRKYRQEFIKFLTYAHASCDETIFHLNMIKDTHQEMPSIFEPFIKPYEDLGAKIHRFIEYVDKNWNRNL